MLFREILLIIWLLIVRGIIIKVWVLECNWRLNLLSFLCLFRLLIVIVFFVLSNFIKIGLLLIGIIDWGKFIEFNKLLLLVICVIIKDWDEKVLVLVVFIEDLVWVLYSFIVWRYLLVFVYKERI